jgi:hypothetical protein
MLKAIYSSRGLSGDMKRWLTVVCLFIAGITQTSQIHAQAAGTYFYSSSTGSSLETITAPVTTTTTVGSGVDDDYASVAPVGFTFPYNSSTFTTFSISTNGWLLLGGGSATGIPSNLTSLGSQNAIFAFGRDANLNTDNGGNFTYGPASGDKYVFQFTNISGGGSGAVSATSYLTTQIVLWGSTSTNPGRIEIIYDARLGTPASAGTIGIVDAAGTYVNGVNGLNNSLATTSSWPALGTKYTFAPPSPCPAPTAQPAALVLTPTAGQVSGSFSAASPAPTNYLVVRYLTGATPTNPVDGTTYTAGNTLGSGTVVSSGTATTFTSTGLTGSTGYDFYVYSYNAGVCLNTYLSAGALTGTVTTLTPVPATCATTFTPLNNATNIATTGLVLSWSGASGDPIPTYDVYFSTNQTLVSTLSASVRVATNISATTFATAGLNFSTNYYWTIVPKNNLATASGCVVNKFTTQAPQPPTCPTTFNPTHLLTGVSVTTTLSWSGATGSPGILGYDVYFSTDSNAVVTKQVATRVAFGVSSVTYTPSVTLSGNTKYFWLVIPVNAAGRSTGCLVNSFTTNSTATKTVSLGGLWSNPATWGGVSASALPAPNDDVIIPDGIIVTVDQAVTINNLTIGQGGTAKSVLQWNGTSNPISIAGSLNIASNGRFLPYSAAATPAGQVVNLGGDLNNNGYADFSLAGTVLNFNGSQQGGGSLSQTMNGVAGAYQGDGTNGIVAQFQVGTTGSVSINTTQNIRVATNFNDYAGSLSTNGKLRLDNTAIVHGQDYNKQVASVVVTGMGVGYSLAPVAAPVSAAPWAAGAVSVGAVRVNSPNIYVAIASGTASVAPTHTTGTALDGTLSWLWVGSTGSIGTAFGSTLTPTLGTQYFLGSRLFTCITAGAMTAANINTQLASLNSATPNSTVVVGAATFVCAGTAAKVSVNYDAGTQTVRSLNLDNPGLGYVTTAPGISFVSVNGSGTTAPVAIAILVQSSVGAASFLTTKSPAATISGGIDIYSGGNTAFTGVGSVYVTNGGVNYTAAPTVGFSLPTGINLVASQGDGYTSTPTVTITGGGGTGGGTGTAIIADGKLVSVYLSGGNYTSWPTISLTGGGATTAGTLLAASNFTNALPTATALIDDARQLYKIVVTNSGFGYLPGTPPTVTLSGGTVTTAASGITARVGAYNLTYNVVAPSNSSPEVNPGAEMPTNNKIAQFVLGSNTATGFVQIKLLADLDVMQTLTLPTATVAQPSTLKLENKKLTFSNPTYGGVTSNMLFGYVIGGDIVMRAAGGTNSRIFPFNPPVTVSTGSSASSFSLSCATNPVFTCGTTSGSTNVTTSSTTNPATFAQIRVGMVVSGTGIPTGATVTAVTTNSFTLSANATATGASASLTFTSPNVFTASTAAIVPGASVTGTGMPTGATVVSVLNSTTFVISANPTSTQTATTLSFPPASGLSTITEITVSQVANPSGISTAPAGSTIANRAVRVQANGKLASTGSVTLNFNTSDVFSYIPQQTAFFIGQAGAPSGPWTIKSVVSGTAGANLAPTTTNQTRVTASTVPGVPTPVNLADGQYFTWIATDSTSALVSSPKGGLWNDPATWANNIVPSFNSEVVIADGATVTVNTSVNVKNLTVGQAGTGAVLNWGTSAFSSLTVRSNFTVNSGATFNPFTAAAAPAGAQINIGGNFVMNGTANLAYSIVNFTGSTLQDGSLNQTLSGNGTIIGDLTGPGRGIIRTLRLASLNGSLTIGWTGTQNIVVNNLDLYSGQLIAGNKLSIDNTAAVAGQLYNRSITSVAVTTMGASYSSAPVVFGVAATPMVPSMPVVLATYYHNGTDVYQCTAAGVLGTTVPSSTASTTFTSGTATMLHIGTLGSIGTPFSFNNRTLGVQYFYKNNLYIATATSSSSVTTPPTHDNTNPLPAGSSYRWIGTVARVTVNFNTTTNNVRSLTITQAGEGYLGANSPSLAPPVIFSPGVAGASQGTAAAATAVVQAPIGVTTAATTVRGTNTSISVSGTLPINNSQGVGSVTYAYGGVNYSAVPPIGFSLPTNFLNLVTAGGSGYSGTLTFTEVGATRLTGGTAATYTGVIANGKVVSVRCTAGGTGYTVAPTSLTISGTTGSGATAAFPAGCLATGTVVLGGSTLATSGSITSVTITNAGFGYESAPSVLLAPASAPANAAGTATVRLGLYEVNYSIQAAPFNVAGGITEDDEIPTNRRINKFTLNNTTGATFTNDLEIFGNSTPLVLTSGIMNFASTKKLLFSHPSYRGIAGNGLTSSVAGIISATTPGGSVTQTFPLETTVEVATGTGADATTGSTITSLTAEYAPAPTGSNGPKGTRSYRVSTNAGALYGVTPTVKLNWNVNDALTGNNVDLFIAQSGAASGPSWTIRSAASGTGAIGTTGTRTTATTPAGLVIVPTGDDYFAWVTPGPIISNVTIPTGANCTPTAQVINADVNFLPPAVANGTNPVMLTYTFTTNGVAATPVVTPMAPSTGSTYTATIPAPPAVNTITTWSITATNDAPYSSTFTGTAYTDSAFAPAYAVTVTKSKESLCGTGGTVILTANSSAPGISYIWSSLGSASLSSVSGSPVTATLTESSDFELLATYGGGCSAKFRTSVGVYPFPASTPSATPSSICIGSNVVINSGLSASNFSASCIVPPNSLSVPPSDVTPNILLNYTTNFPYSTTVGSDVVTTPNTFNIYPGTPITGTSIPASATVTAILSPTTFRISAAATGTGSYTAGTLNRNQFGGATDDGVINNLPIGFTYNYFGVNQTTFSPSQNAMLIIGGNGTTSYSFPAGFPSPTSPLNCIALAGRDLNVGNQRGVPASILYWTEGTAPNRKMIIQYIQNSTWSTPLTLLNGLPDGYSTIEGVLFETTGNVEIRAFALVNVANCFNVGCASFITEVRNKLIGVQNGTGTIGATAPNCANDIPNYWNARQDSIPASSPQAWRFVPPHDYTLNYTSSNGGFSGASSGLNLFTTSALPTTTGPANYTITYTDLVTSCNNNSSPAFASVNVVNQPVTPIIASPITVFGSQAVTLTISNGASVPAGSTVRWYNASTGGSLLGVGVSFTSSLLTDTTTFYVAVENSACSSVRVPVVVNIGEPPLLTVSSPTLCGAAGVQITPLSVTSPSGNYDTYVWSPTTNLYQDAAGTIQYTGQSLTTVYVKTNSVYNAQSSAPTTYSYTVNAYDFASGAQSVATSLLTLQPPAGIANITSSVPFICVSAPATLTLTPATTPGTVQWQNSSDGINFSDIPGATNNTYLTDVLTTAASYRVILYNQSNAICSYSDTLFLTVSNPQVTSANGGSVCGGGSVNLTATGPGTINWYAAQTGGSFFAQGPSVSSLAITTSPTSFWVASSVAGCVGTRTEVIATITAPSAVVVPATQSVCSNGVVEVALPNNVDYNSYVWSPATEIYTDATATTLITPANSYQTVYIKPLTTGLSTYTVTASKVGVAACQTTANVQINRLPATATVTAFPASICLGGTATLSATAASSLVGAQYQWQISTVGSTGPFTDISGATAASYVTLPASVVQWYQVIIKNSNGSDCITSAPLTLDIADPQISSTSGGFRCSAGTVTLSALGSAGTTLRWYASNVSTTVLGTGPSFITPVISTTTSYWVAAEISGCSSPRVEVFATINVAAAITLTPATTACNGEIVTLSVTPNANYTNYTWTNTASTLYSDAAATIAYAGQSLASVYAKSTTVANRSYTVTATNPSSGCSTTAVTSVRTVPATATVSASPAAICAGGNSDLTLSNGAQFTGATIQWQSASNLGGPYSDISGANAATYNTGAVSSTTYYQAVVKNSANTICFTTTPVTLSVDNPLLLTTTADSACGNSIVILQATASAGATIKWYDALTGGNLVGTGSPFYTPVISATTTYYAEAAFGTTCASTPRVAVTATINSTSASPVTVSANQTICNGDVATLSTPTTVDYDTYLWSPAAGLYNNAGATTPYTNGNLLTVYAANTVADAYSYYVTASNTSVAGCKSTAKTTVTVLPGNGNVTVASSVSSICNSGTATLTVTPATGYGAGTIEWQSSTDNINFTATGSTAATYVTGSLTDTTYFRAVIKNGAATCTISDTVVVEVITPLVGTVTGAQLCGSGSLTLLANSASNTTLTWFAGPATSTVLATGNVYTTPSISTTTIYYVQAAIGSCISNAPRTPVTATITAPSAVVATAAASSVCNGGIVAISVTPNSDYDTYEWNNASGELYQDPAASSPYASQNLTTVYVKSTTSGSKTYSVTASNSGSSCSNTGSVTVNVLPVSLTITQTATVCVTGSTTLSFSSVGFTGAGYQWETSPTGASGSYTAIGGATGTSYVTPVISSTTYYRVVVKDGSNNVCFTSAQFELKVVTPVVAGFSANSRCGTGTVTLSASPTDPLNTINWYADAAGTTLLASGLSYTTPSISATTNYYVAAAKGTCVGTVTGPVVATVNAAPAITVNPVTQTVCNNVYAPISVVTDPAYNRYTWAPVAPTPANTLYTNTSGTLYNLSTSNTNLFARTVSAGNQQYRVTATNTGTGCTSTAVTTVIVQPASSLLSSTPDAICVTGTADLKLTPAPSSNVIWQESSTGLPGSFTTIAGATGLTYTTPVIASTTYYQAVVSNGTSNCYTSNVKTLDISNPSVLTVGNATRCGSGTLTLSATASPGATIYWYTSKTGASNSFVASGNTFVTPSLSANTVYYVSAGIGDCYSERTDAFTDTAFVQSAPLLSINQSQTVCNSALPFKLQVSSDSTAYNSYVWTQLPTSPARLYQDDQGTVLYNTGVTNLATVWANASTVATTTYSLTATNTSSGCAATTTVTLSVLPSAASATVTAIPSTVCISDNATLNLSGGPYPAGSIQWQKSPDGLTFTNIPLANLPSYTTLVQASERYYRVVISNSNLDACIVSPTVAIAVDNPQVVSTANVTRCGPATTVVSATASAGASLTWYPSETSNTVLGTGTSFTTPVIRETTTYWVGANIGSCSGGRAQVTVTYVAPPALAITPDQSVCSNIMAAVSVTPATLSNYSNFSWTSDSALYVDLAGTIPYVNQNVSTVYTKGANGFTLVRLNAWDGPAGSPATLTSCVNTVATLVTFVKVEITTVTSAPAVICEGSNATLTALADAIIGTGPQTPPVGYLASAATSTADEEIYGVTFGTINTTSNCSSTGGPGSTLSLYSNYTNLPPATVTIGQTLPLTVTLGYCGTIAYSNRATAYFDWNRDGDFLDSQEAIDIKPFGALASATIPQPFTISITPPASAQPGVTRMRIVYVESSIISSTGTYTWGETEDYLINIRSFVQPTYNYVWTPGNLSGSTVNAFIADAATTFTVTATDSASGCIGTAQITVTPTAGPNSPAATNSSQCGFGIPTATVSDTTGAATPVYTWYSAATGVNVLQSGPSNTYLSPINTATTFYVALNNGVCSGYPRTPVTVAVSTPDQVSATAIPDTICLGSSITLSAVQTGSSNVYGFNWSADPAVGSGFVTTNLSAPSVLYNSDFSTDAGSATLNGNASVTGGYLQLTPAAASQLGGITVNGNGTSFDSLAVTFDLSFTPAGGADGISYSFGDDVSATATIPNAENGTGTKFKVSFDAYGSPGAGVQGIYIMYNCNVTNQLPTTTGVLAYVNNTSWVNTASPVPVSITIDKTGKVTVSLNGTPVTGLIDIQLPAAYLNANKATWNHVVKARTGAITALQYIDNFNIAYSTFLATAIPGQAISVTPTAPGTYSYSVIGTDGVCAAVDTVQVLVNPVPAAVNAGSDLSVCAGSFVALTATSAALPGASITWSSIPAGFTANTASSSFGPINVPTRFVATVSNGLCSVTDTVFVNASTSLGTPVLAFVGAQTSICNSGSAILQVVAADPTAIYQWQQSATGLPGSWITLSGAIGSVFQTPVINTTLYYRVYGSCGVFAADTSAALEVLVTTPSIVSTIPATRCGTGSVTLTANSDPGSTVNWYANQIGGLPVATGAAYTTPSIGSTTTFYAAASSGGGLTTTVGKPAYNTTDGTNAAGAYLIFDAFSSFNLSSVVIYPFSATSGTPGTVTISWANSSGVVLQSTTVSVTGNNTPEATVVPLGFNITPGSQHRLVYTASTGVTAMYRDFTASATTFPYTLPGVVSITNGSLSGYYYYFYNWTVTTGCESARVPVVATVTTPPAVTISGTTTICNGQSTTLTASSPNDPDYSYVWSTSANGAAQSFSPTSTATYSVLATDTTAGPNAGCANLVSATVTVNPTPTVPTIVQNPLVACGGTPITLTANSVQEGTTQVGTGVVVNGTSGSSPYSANWEGSKIQYLIPASELIAAGIIPGPITKLAFNVTAQGTFPQSEYTIKLGHSSVSSLTAYQSGLTTVYTAPGTVNPALGWNNYNFTTPFSWNGTSNLIVEVCHNNDPTGSCLACFGLTTSVQATTTAYQSTFGQYADNTVPANPWDLCSQISTGTVVNGFSRPNMQIGYGASSTFLWSGGQTTAAITFTPPNGSTTYSVTAANTFGCTSSNSKTVNASANPLPIVTPASDTVLCFGSIIKLAVKDTGFYSAGYPAGTVVDWLGIVSGLSPNDSINSDNGTSYQVRVTLPSGCQALSSTRTVITRAVNTSAVVTSPACGSNNGKIVTTVTGGSAPYRYIWKLGAATLFDRTTNNPSDSIVGLAPGNYTLEVADSVPFGCSSGLINYNLTSSAPVVASISGGNLNCNGDSIAIGSTHTGGTGAVTYLWSTGSTTQNLSAVFAGTYTVTITDALGCFDTESITITQPTAITAPFTVTKPTCVGDADGAVSAAVSGGTTPYQALEWYDLNLNPYGNPGDNAITGLLAGDYQLIIVDGNGCEFLDTVTVTDPAPLAITGFTPGNGAIGTVVTITGTSFTGATVVTFNATPATVFTVVNSTTITATVPAGATTGTISVTTPCGTATSTGTFTVNIPTFATFNLTTLIEGYYIGGGQMTSVLLNQGISLSATESDSIRVELRDALSPSTVVGTATVVLDIDGNAIFTFPASTIGQNVYIALFHRNAVQTWSALPITVASSNTYDFTSASSQAFADNMKEVEPGVWALFSGDMNQDEFVDVFDFPQYDLDNASFASGYFATDLNGDGFVDVFDFPLFDANNSVFIMSIHP